MSDDPEAVRLARNWRAHTPPDRSPAYIADDLARSVLSQHDENTRLRAALAESITAWADYAEQEDYKEQLARIAELRKDFGL